MGLLIFLVADLIDTQTRPDYRKNSGIKLLVLLALVMFLGLILCIKSYGQAVVIQSPVPKFRDFLPSGAPNAGGCVYTYISGTTTPQATYTDSTGNTPQTNPVILDANGEAPIWITANTYRFQVWTFGSGSVGGNCGNGTQRYQIDGVADKGLIQLISGSLLLNPGGHVNQTVLGPITADQFTGPATAATKSFQRQTTSNSPSDNTVAPAAPNQVYNVPDPGTGGNYVINPSGNSGTSNTLDCTLAGITCKRSATYYFAGAGCNNVTSALGWDSFGTNSPTPQCLTGANIQKGVLSLPSAFVHIQSNTGTQTSGGSTVTTTYPAALLGGTGDLLILSVAFNATTTITGCTDGTNAYTQAKHVANGALSVDIWVFHSPTTKAAGTTLTCTSAIPTQATLSWHEYQAPAATSTDVTASNTGTGTAVTTGTTASTAQATELVFAAAGDLAGAAGTFVVNTAGYVNHGVVQGTQVQSDDAGIIQQTIAGQSAAFTIGSSQTWAAAIVTIKAANGGQASAQRTVVLPTFFAAMSINSSIKWTNPAPPVGTSNVVLGTQLVCSADGGTDDPSFLTATTATNAVSTSAAGIIQNTPLNGLVATGCAAGNILHFKIFRDRYNVADTYEGFVQVIGASLIVGVTQ